MLEKTKTTDLIKMPQTAEQEQTKEQNEAQEKAAAEAKEAFLDEAAKPAADPTQQAQDTQSESNLSLTAKQDGDTITVLTKMLGVSAGECVLQIKNGAASTEQKAQIIYQPEFSSCAGFSVAKSALGVGQWIISLSVTTTAGQTLSQTQTLEVK